MTLGTQRPTISKPFQWNDDKSARLRATRGIGFEEIVVALRSSGLREVARHPDSVRYPRQQLWVVAIDDYAYLVPVVEEDEYYFLKTIIPSRKATRDYLRGGRDA